MPWMPSPTVGQGTQHCTGTRDAPPAGSARQSPHRHPAQRRRSTPSVASANNGVEHHAATAPWGSPISSRDTGTELRSTNLSRAPGRWPPEPAFAGRAVFGGLSLLFFFSLQRFALHFIMQFLEAVVRSICRQAPSMATSTVEQHSSPGQQLSRDTTRFWTAFNISSFLTTSSLSRRKEGGEATALSLQIPLHHTAT